MNSLHPAGLIKKMIPYNARGKIERDVSIGDRFEQQDGAVSLWVVERISQVRMSRFPLVSLARVGHPDITKTISLSALSRDNEYRYAL